MRAHATALAIAGAAFVVMLAIAGGVFRAHPFCMDEYGYVYQAEIFAEGKTHVELPAELDALRELYVVTHDGKTFSKYPPGFSMVLALGVKLGVPFAINPLLGAVTLLLLYVVVLRLAGKRAALTAQVLLASNPFFVAYSASLFAHALTLALVMGVLVILTDPPSTRRWLALGALLGALIWVRPVDAFAAGIFVTFVVVRRDGWRRALKAGAIAALPFAAFALALMAYNAALSGRFALSTYPVLDGEFKLSAGSELSFVDNVTAVADDYVRRLVREGEVLWGHYFVWPAGVVVPLLALGAILLRAGERPWRIALAFHFVVVVLLYNFHGMPSPVPTWPQYGARYWYSGFGAIVILAVLALVELGRRIQATPRHGVIGVGAIVVLQLAIGVSLFVSYAQRFELQAAIAQDIERTCPGKRLVVLDLPARSRLPVFVRPEDFKRNPFFTGERLFVIGTPDPALVRALPGYTTCRYGFVPWSR